MKCISTDVVSLQTYNMPLQIDPTGGGLTIKSKTLSDPHGLTVVCG